MQKKQKVLVALVLAAAVVGAVALLLVRGTAKPSEPAQPSADVGAAHADAGVRGKGAAGAAAKGMPLRERMNTADREDLSPEDKRLMTTIEDALEAEDLKKLLSVFDKVLKSPNAELRSDMVDALDWFGVKAMPELLAFVTDPDEDIAQEALSAWTSALSDIESDKERLSLVEKAMAAITDEDALESMVMEVDDCDDVKAVQTLLNVISSGNPKAVKVAKRHYRFLTDEKFTTFEAAEEWLQKNYEVDDDEEDGAVVKYSSLHARDGGGTGAASTAAAEPDGGEEADPDAVDSADAADPDDAADPAEADEPDDADDPDDAADPEGESDSATAPDGSVAPAQNPAGPAS